MAFCSCTVAITAQCRFVPIAMPDSIATPAEQFSPNTLIISYSNVADNHSILLRAVAERGAQLIYDYNIINAIAIRIADGSIIDTEIAYYKQVDGVIAVERDRIMHLYNAE